MDAAAGVLIFFAIAFLPFLLLLKILSWCAAFVIGWALAGRPSCVKWQTRARWAVLVGVPVSSFVALCLMMYEGDDFYLQRYALVALHEPPAQAKVVAASSNKIGMHSGDSCAYARVALPKADYDKLLASVASDTRFGAGNQREETMVNGKPVTTYRNQVLETDEMRDVQGRAGPAQERASFVCLDQRFPSQHMSLIFLDDGEQVDVNSCI